MNRYTLRAAVVLLACLTAWPSAFAQPTTGTCQLGRAEKDLDVNSVLARVFNTGSLFYGNSSEAAYLVPQSSGNSPVYASGIWIGGQVEGELRMAGATYGDYEFWPGPLGDDGRPVDPSDCSSYDRIYKVSRGDIQTFEGSGIAAADLAGWPVALGAPVIAAPDNGIDDDGDGLVDEGTDGEDNDGDGSIDERDERERVTEDGARGLAYDLAGGDRPDIIGDQAVWWVMNDVGNTHENLNTPPLGVEVQVLAWAFSRADALGETTFYRYRVINKSADDIENTYLSVFSDPDLGDAADDMVGSDVEEGLGFVYNAGDVDARYGIPPAAGYDFFQGPIVDGDTLGTDNFMYFQNGSGPPPTQDPQDATSYYNFMTGVWGDGVAVTARGDGYQTDGDVTKFAFPGDPVTGEFWSEENANGNGEPTGTGSDRRFLISTGPFTLEPNTPQDIVFGIIFGQGSDRLNSITVLRNADRLAQAAYDIDFELPPPPPPPPACDASSPDPQLQPGSGTCAEAVGQDQAVTLVWGYPTSSENYLGSFQTVDRLVLAAGGDDPTYEFEGFNIYRYPTSAFSSADRELVATYDKVNGVTQVIDSDTDPVTQEERFFVTATGTDSGLEFTLTFDGLTNYKDYFFGITAYSFNEQSIPKVLESSATQLTGRPSRNVAGNGGTILNADRGELILGTQTTGGGTVTVAASVVDPTQLMNATYSVEFISFDADDDPATMPLDTYVIRRDGETIFDGRVQFAENGIRTGLDSQNFVVDGLRFFTRAVDAPVFTAFDADGFSDIAGDGRGIIEVAYPGLDVCPDPSASGAADPGCAAFDGAGNTVYLNTNTNEDYFVSDDNGDGIGRFRQFVASAAPYDYEMRFTEGDHYGLRFGSNVNSSRNVWSVPFELWNVGTTPNDPSDDIRMIPMIINPSGEEDFVWEDSYPQDYTLGADTYPATSRVFWMMPDRPNGYELFAQTAAAIGVGNVYVDTDVTDTPIDKNNLFIGDIDPTTGEVCDNTGGYISFCYRNDQTTPLDGAEDAGDDFVQPINRMRIVDFAGDGTTPPTGTVIRVVTTAGDFISPGDVFTFSTADFVAEQNSSTAAQEALDLIAAVPNPYLGSSAYESDNTERVVRFTNLPDLATIRIFTVNGSLVRRINKEGPSRSADWDLTTENNLPAASGMYFVHIEVPGVGDRVLKLGVVNRQTEVITF